MPELGQIHSAKTYLYKRAQAFFQIDSRSLGIFRITLGLTVFIDLLLRLRSFELFYKEEGAISLATALQISNESLSLFFIDWVFLSPALIFAIGIFSAIFMILGFFSRFFTIVNFLVIISIQHRAPVVTTYADDMLAIMLFWAIFLPLNLRYSIDSIIDFKSNIKYSLVPKAAVLLQVVYIHFINSIHKIKYDFWLTGDILPRILAMDHLTILLGMQLGPEHTFLKFGGMFWAFLLLISPLLIILKGLDRIPIIISFLASYILMSITLNVGIFSLVLISSLMLFLPPEIFSLVKESISSEKTKNLSRSIESLNNFFSEKFNLKIPRLNNSCFELFSSIIIVSVILISGLHSLTDYGALNQEDSKAVDAIEDTYKQVQQASSYFGIKQEQWKMFSRPMANGENPASSYHVGVLEKNGEYIDFHNRRPLTFDRPEEDRLGSFYSDWRMRPYGRNLRHRGNSSELVDDYLGYVCDDFYSYDRPEKHLKLYAVGYFFNNTDNTSADENNFYYENVAEYTCINGINQSFSMDPRNFSSHDIERLNQLSDENAIISW